MNMPRRPRAPARLMLLVVRESPVRLAAGAGWPECQWLSAPWIRRRDSHSGQRKASGMTDHNGVLMMQRMLLAGTLGLAMARKAAAILEGEPGGEARAAEGAVLRAILDAANECLGHFDDRPASERWCD